MTLYLVPAPLDFGCAPEQQTALTDVLPLATLQIAARLEHWVCENAKSTRAYLKRVNEVVPLSHTVQALNLQELPRLLHKKGDRAAASDASGELDKALRALLSPALAGLDMGLVSEAGMPAVADPGAALVRVAHKLGIQVQPLVGPVSLLLALAASGLNGQSFAFVGYLPQDANVRAKRIVELQTLAERNGQTQLFIETPYRNTALLAALLQQLKPQTHLSVSTALSLPSAQTHSASVSQWRQKPPKLDLTLPAVFGLGV
jgi:16S rRNA (cytidine1402-2'-O)-methyltransferase